MAVAVGTWALVRNPSGTADAGTDAATCTDTVQLTVTPELAEPLRDLLSEPVFYSSDRCTTAEVVAQEPLQTVANLAVVSPDRLPDLWVPDSSLWLARTSNAPVEIKQVGALASSPVVLATSREAATALGWVKQPPTWGQAVASGLSVVTPDVASSAEAIAALASVQTSLGGGEDAEGVVVRTVLSASRAGVPTRWVALDHARGGAEDAPLVPVTEQEVFTANTGTKDSSLVAVYPADGSPSLDYPLTRLARPGAAGHAEPAAVDAVADVLTSTEARTLLWHAGFRDPAGSDLSDAAEAAGVQEGTPAALDLSPESVKGLLERLAELARPSQLLAVVDVSTSMQAEIGGGQTRIGLAREATRSTLGLFPDQSSIGFWTFASDMTPETDWEVVAPIRRLGDAEGGVTHRERLAVAFDSLPDRLRSGGTSLYDTTLAAVRAAREAHDPSAFSTVVVVTDGRNEDSTSISLPDLVSTLKSEATPEAPVKVVTIGIGPTADSEALEQIAAATGGSSYSVNRPQDMQEVLFDAVSRR